MGAVAADHHWVILSRWLVKEFMSEGAQLTAALQRLTDTVFVSITVLPSMKNVLVSEYEDAEESREAFVATGSMFRYYKGKLTVDGGGSDCAPLFKDEAREQLVVTLTESGLPMGMMMRANLEEAAEAFRKGQDDVVDFFNGDYEGGALEIKDERTTWKAQAC